ncbi:MAG TPA: 16S rRNA (guanine(966)-N(2))-methyltransferase RsmD [bacterium]|jgi:16S rRNA (guanine966-N2)-methyltransferase|nr:16S rRNA (guanine(966)-N(2))-methyltransferase RsmD [bacterium]
MKIFSGTARGRFVNVPKGADLRPTTDKTRLALFNAIGQLVPDSRFLDLCCGSGSVGLEALSRGAAKVVFVDSQRLCVESVKASAAAFGFESARVEAWCADLQRGMNQLAGRRQRFDLVYVDPPYDAALGKPALQGLVKHELLERNPATRVMLEHAGDGESPEVEGLQLYRRYDHGAASVSIYGLEGMADAL